MRFISKFQAYKHGIRVETAMVLATGRVQVIESEIIAQFQRADVLLHEKVFAKQHFIFAGMPTQIDEVTPIDPSYRLSAYDTAEEAGRNHWDEETRELVEQTLLNSPNYGQDFVMVPPTHIPLPWPSYDEIRSAKRIAALTRELGIDPEIVLTYERNNAKRDDVIEAVQSFSEPEPEESEDLVEA